MKPIPGGNICTPKGFLASALHCGLKKSGKPDICLLVSERPATAAAAFTTNKFRAAPVELSERTLAKSLPMRAIVVNSGNANACTGKKGMENARAMAAVTAKALGIKPGEVLVCSTGRIGVQLPMDKLEKGITAAATSLGADKGSDAAGAIMTTDLAKKECAVSFRTSGGPTVSIGAMTKGSGMISPKMRTAHPHATMLSFITCDADVEEQFLRKTFDSCVRRSFNMITVDNDMSTNDSVIMLANGAAGNRRITAKSPDAAKFADALLAVMEKMARSIVLDGEGATKFVTVLVEKARSDSDAELCARAICNSMLCKTAWFGGDPNWGRILAAAGYSGAKFSPDKTDLFYNRSAVIRKGRPVETPEEKLAREVSGKELLVRISLGAGKKSCTMWTSDLSYDYVKINADYRT